MPRQFNFIFKELVNGDDDIVGLLAYSLYKKEKISWIQNFKKSHDKRDPNEEEISSFHDACNTKERLSSYKKDAVSLLTMVTADTTKKNSKVGKFFYGVLQSIVATIIVGILFWCLYIYFNTTGKFNFQLGPQGIEQVEGPMESSDI